MHPRQFHHLLSGSVEHVHRVLSARGQRVNRARFPSPMRPVTALVLVALFLGVTLAHPETHLARIGKPVLQIPAADRAGEGFSDGFPGTVVQLAVPEPPTLTGPFTSGGGIPPALLVAYRQAETRLAATHPDCGLRWHHLAAIAQVDSGHAHNGRITPTGDTLVPLYGPVLTGSPGIPPVPDTDAGTLDADDVWDRAVGPLHLTPTAWTTHRQDANGDGVANPHNIYDATLTAGNHLCSGNTRLPNPQDLQAALARYNPAPQWATAVTAWMLTYAALASPAAPQHQSSAPPRSDPPDPYPLPEPIPDPKPIPPQPAPQPEPVTEPVPAPEPTPTPPAQPTPTPAPPTQPEPTPQPEPSTQPEPVSQPTAQLTAEHPTTTQPTDTPTITQPTTEQPATQPIAAPPTTQPTNTQPTTQQPAAAAAEQPTTRPTTEQATAAQPATRPSTHEPTTEQPITQPVTQLATRPTEAAEPMPRPIEAPAPEPAAHNALGSIAAHLPPALYDPH
ncbi:lysozyme family protein [Actinokineospora iranica]|uniref:Membrane-bound lytic murein transglycosylase B n=1 Tax=Actinokineospora iranica TaxID=1271860 RepID=A0A1G6M9I3_9PSEU|nr:hypothetical protein [Actinokineospora iranica]SDC51595.1 hypothetical protein SAMN05216174_102415 [Actinokineospora iranica]